jgi:hypothetical protein
MSGESSNLERGPSLVNRLHFLYKVVEDTQATIRFLDTKAAFCVTLLSGMAFVILQRPVITVTHRILLSIFLTNVIISLLVCLRVIFPTIKPSGTFGIPQMPKFYVGHNKAHHWLLHTIANPVDDVLSETLTTYRSALETADDHDLLAAMCEAALMLALIRQLKSDRLHAAMFCLGISVLLFAAVVLI